MKCQAQSNCIPRASKRRPVQVCGESPVRSKMPPGASASKHREKLGERGEEKPARGGRGRRGVKEEGEGGEGGEGGREGCRGRGGPCDGCRSGRSAVVMSWPWCVVVPTAMDIPKSSTRLQDEHCCQESLYIFTHRSKGIPKGSIQQPLVCGGGV